MPYDQIVFIGYVIDTSAGVIPSPGSRLIPASTTPPRTLRRAAS